MAKSRSVFRYCIRNWPAYNRALIDRGRLTVWCDEQAIAGWRNTEPAAGPGAPRLYADLAIECALVFKSVYHLSLRAAQGFLSSVMELRQLTLPIPDYSTVSRRQEFEKLPGVRVHFVPMILCPSCQQPATKRDGYDEQRRQRYSCRFCHRDFTTTLRQPLPAIAGRRT